MKIHLRYADDDSEVYLRWEADHLACLPEVVAALPADTLAGYSPAVMPASAALMSDMLDHWSDEYRFSGTFIFEKADS